MSRKTYTLKKRNWTMVVWVESAPTNWIDIIQQKGIQFSVSPIHDRDYNENGELVKEHYHVLLHYDGPTTFNNVYDLCKELNQSTINAVDSVVGMYRYHTHKDNPEKAQYNSIYIRNYNGFNIDKILNDSDMNVILNNIFLIVDENKIYNYKALITFIRNNIEKYDQDYLYVCFHKTYTINCYLKSNKEMLFKD